MIPDWTEYDIAWLKQCHVASDGACDHDRCGGCDCACHYADAEAETAFDQQIIACQGASLREASNKICDQDEALKANLALIESLNLDNSTLRMSLNTAKAENARIADERNTYRIWFWMCVGAVVAMLIAASIAWRQG